MLHEIQTIKRKPRLTSMKKWISPLIHLMTHLQSQREAFTSLTHQTILLQNEFLETTIDLRAIAEKNVAGSDNLSDLAIIYAQTQQIWNDPEQAAGYERRLSFNKIISLNRLQVVLQASGFSSAAVYADNKLSHYVTTTEAGMSTVRANQDILLKTDQNQAGDLESRASSRRRSGCPGTVHTDRLGRAARGCATPHRCRPFLVSAHAADDAVRNRSQQRDSVTQGGYGGGAG